MTVFYFISNLFLHFIFRLIYFTFIVVQVLIGLMTTSCVPYQYLYNIEKCEDCETILPLMGFEPRLLRSTHKPWGPHLINLKKNYLFKIKLMTHNRCLRFYCVIFFTFCCIKVLLKSCHLNLVIFFSSPYVREVFPLRIIIEKLLF